MSSNNGHMAQTKKAGPESTAEERAAARQRAKELKAQEAAAAALQSVRDKIASLDEPDKTNAERIHAIVTRVAPSLAPKLLYGSPAYANADGKPVLSTRSARGSRVAMATSRSSGPHSSTMARCGPRPTPSPSSHRPTRRSSRSLSARRSATEGR